MKMMRVEGMGKTYSYRTLATKELPQLSSPILLCKSRPDFDKAIIEAGYQTVRLNLSLARSLVGLSPNDIQSVIGEKILETFPQKQPIYLIDYEMLFDPRYRLDVLRLFIDLSRWNKLIVKWIGGADGDTLIYAEPGFEDYKRYNINEYDVSVIK